jgi:hypothetical protein
MGLKARVGGPVTFLARGAASRWRPSSPAPLALLAQVVAFPLTAGAAAAAPWFGAGLSLASIAFLQGLVAAIIGASLGLRPWWFPIHLLFMPSLLWTLSLEVAPGWFLGAFMLLLLVYWGIAHTQVPLFLSSREASRVLARLLPEAPGFRMLDLGAGFGGVLADLSLKRPDGDFMGIEIAPLPFVVGWLRQKKGRGSYQMRLGSFWSHSLAPYDVVYAYLSPVPMAELWRKAAAEMRPGSLLVSNAFAVPGIAADETIQLGDLHSSRLYLYRMPPIP